MSQVIFFIPLHWFTVRASFAYPNHERYLIHKKYFGIELRKIKIKILKLNKISKLSIYIYE